MIDLFHRNRKHVDYSRIKTIQNRLIFQMSTIMWVQLYVVSTKVSGMVPRIFWIGVVSDIERYNNIMFFKLRRVH